MLLRSCQARPEKGIIVIDVAIYVESSCYKLNTYGREGRHIDPLLLLCSHKLPSISPSGSQILVPK